MPGTWLAFMLALLNLIASRAGPSGALSRMGVSRGRAWAPATHMATHTSTANDAWLCSGVSRSIARSPRPLAVLKTAADFQLEAGARRSSGISQNRPNQFILRCTQLKADFSQMSNGARRGFLRACTARISRSSSSASAFQKLQGC